MRKSNFKILALTAALIMPLSSCKETIIYVTPEDTPNDDIKTPIELSVGGVDGAVETSSTRAVVTTAKTDMISLTADTHIFMLMKSEYDELTGDYASLNYGGAQSAKYTTTRGKVGSDDKVVFDDDATNTRTRYWDDAHARSSKLSIWALACDGLQSLGGTGTSLTETSNIFYDNTTIANANTNSTIASNVAWRTNLINAKLIQWNVPHGTNSAQDATTVKNRDLLFSNNLAKYTDSDNRLKYNITTTPKAFTGGKLVFYHALSKITVNLNIGEGFTGTNDFRFPSSQNVKLSYFNIWGQFSAEDGEFLSVNNAHESIGAMWNRTGNTPNTTVSQKPAYWLEANVIPYSSTDSKETIKGSQFTSNGTHVMMEFTIDNSTYKLTSKQLFDAIKNKAENNISTDASSIEMEAGKNYVFTFTVSKTKIEHITASVVNWEEVVANEYTPIIDVNQTYGVAGDDTALNKTYTLLRSTSKAGSYGNGSCSDGNSAKMEYNTTDNKYNAMAPQLYWPDHKTHYFFRGVYPNIESTTGHPTLNSDGQTISVTNCAYAAGKSPSDLMIGIPRNADGSFDEKCKVTEHKSGTTAPDGICATSGNINLNFRYAMSQVEVRLTTNTATGATDAVNIATAKVEVINGCNGGAIKLEDSSVASRTTGDFTIGMTTTDTETKGNSSVIPQSLTNGSNNLRFKITIYKTGSTTEIDDIYYADIKDIKVKVGTADPATITSWEAGKHYIYTLNLKKTDIKVSATITDWVTATGSTNVWF